MVNHEALACGTPVITYNTGGSAEAVIKETGVIIERGDIPAAMSAIIEICNKEKEVYQDACRNNIISRFQTK